MQLLGYHPLKGLSGDLLVVNERRLDCKLVAQNYKIQALFEAGTSSRATCPTPPVGAFGTECTWLALSPRKERTTIEPEARKRLLAFQRHALLGTGMTGV